MLERISVLSSLVCFPKVDSHTIDLTLLEYSKIQSNGVNFKMKKQFRKTFDDEKKIIWHGTSVVGDHRSFLKVLLLLIQFENGDLSVMYCANRLSSMELIQLATLNLNPSLALISNHNIACTDGPAIVITESNYVHFFSSLYQRTIRHDLKPYVGETYVLRILSFLHVWQTQRQNTHIQIYLVTLLMCDNEGEKCVKLFIIAQGTTEKEFCDKLFCIGTHLLFPPYYGPVVSAVHVHCHCNSNFKMPGSNIEQSQLEDLITDNSTIVCTSNQFLVFHQSVLKHVCKLPLPNIEHIMSILKPRAPFEKWSFFLTSLSGICNLNLCEKTNEFKCANLWEGAVHVLSADFKKTCSQQIIVLFSLDSNTWQESCSFLPLSLNKQSSKTDVQNIPREILKTTISSLQKKIMSGKSAIAKLEHDIAENNAAICQVLDQLENNDCNNSQLPVKNVDSLLDIILYQDEEKKKLEWCNVKKNEPMLCIIDHWKMVLGGNWIVGWTLRNTSENCCAKDFSLAMVVQGTEMEYVQNSFVHPVHFTLPKPKRNHLNPGELVSVASCLQLPMFVSECFEISCVICWNIGLATPQCTTRDIFIKEKIPSQKISTVVSLSVKEVLNDGELGECSIIQKLLSFRVSQESVMVIISTSTSSLSSFDRMLTSKKNISLPEILDLDFKCAVFNDRLSPLCGVNFTWIQVDMKNIEAEIFVRNETEAVLLVQWLYTVLPCDVAVLPRLYNEASMSKLKQKLLLAMKEEVDLILSAFVHSDMVKQAHATDAQGSSSKMVENSEESSESNRRQLAMVRETYLRFRKSLATREVVTDHLVQQLSEL